MVFTIRYWPQPQGRLLISLFNSHSIPFQALSDDMPVGCTVVNVEDVYRVLYVSLKLQDSDADNFATNFATAASSLGSDAAVVFLKHYSDNKNEIQERFRNCREILNNFHSVTFDDFKYIMVR